MPGTPIPFTRGRLRLAVAMAFSVVLSGLPVAARAADIGGLAVTKYANPQGEEFPFTTSGGSEGCHGDTTLQLGHGESITCLGVIGDTITISELDPGPNWVVDIDCTGQGAEAVTIDEVARSVTFTITVVNELPTCFFSNHPPTATTATLVVVKHVVNDDGGAATAADFVMSVANESPSPATFAGSEIGISVTLVPGSYSVSESGPGGYAQTGSDADCSGSIAAGESRICTLTNDDLPQSGELLNTGTTCGQFLGRDADGPAPAGTGLDELLYTVKGTNINSVAPGVFFYYTLVNLPLSGSSTVMIDQVPPAAFPRPIAVGKNQVRVYDIDCNSYPNVSLAVDYDSDVVVRFGPSASGGRFIVAVKYDATSLSRLAPPPGGSADYTWQTLLGSVPVAADPDGLVLRRKPKG